MNEKARGFSLIRGGKYQSNARSINNGEMALESRTLQQREANDRERREEIEREGRSASKALDSWRRRIPMEDRRRMALNMDVIVRRHNIKPGNLNWGRDYGCAEQFRNTFSRCRLSDTKAVKAKLLATPREWIRVIDYIREYIEERRGEFVSREILMEELVRGTRFHPSKNILTVEDKISEMLYRLSDRICHEYSLLKHYRESALLRVHYFRENGKLIGHKPWLGTEAVFEWDLTSLFGGESFWDELPNKSFRELSKNEWKIISGQLDPEKFPNLLLCRMHEFFAAEQEEVGASPLGNGDEDFHFHDLNIKEYFDLRESEKIANFREKSVSALTNEEWKTLISEKDLGTMQLELLQLNTRSWNDLRDPERCILSDAFNSGINIRDLPQYPHAFIGRFDYSFPYGDENPMLDPDDSAWKCLIKSGMSNEDVDSWINSCDSEYEYEKVSSVFLVMVPDLNRRELVPYFHLNYDGSGFYSVDAKSLRDNENRYLPVFPPGGPAIVKSLTDIVMDDVERIVKDLKTTAKVVADSDPYINQVKEREARIDNILSVLWEK